MRSDFSGRWHHSSFRQEVTHEGRGHGVAVVAPGFQQECGRWHPGAVGGAGKGKGVGTGDSKGLTDHFPAICAAICAPWLARLRQMYGENVWVRCFDAVRADSSCTEIVFLAI